MGVWANRAEGLTCFVPGGTCSCFWICLKSQGDFKTVSTLHSWHVNRMGLGWSHSTVQTQRRARLPLPEMFLWSSRVISLEMGCGLVCPGSCLSVTQVSVPQWGEHSPWAGALGQVPCHCHGILKWSEWQSAVRWQCLTHSQGLILQYFFKISLLLSLCMWFKIVFVYGNLLGIF